MESYLKHYGVKGMKKGVNRYYNPDGTLTAEGRRHYQIGANDKVHYTSNGFTSTSSDGQRSVGVARFNTKPNTKPTSKPNSKKPSGTGWFFKPFKPVGNPNAKPFPSGAKGPGSLRNSKSYPAGAKGPGGLLIDKKPSGAKGPGSLINRDAKGPGSIKPTTKPDSLTSKKPKVKTNDAIPLKPKKTSDTKKPKPLTKKDRTKKLVNKKAYYRLTDLR